MSLFQCSLSGKINQLKTVNAELFPERANGKQFVFDLKAIKPDVSNFERTLLEWVGFASTKNQQKVHAHILVVIPYNPSEPQPCPRWVTKGMLDLSNNLNVAGDSGISLAVRTHIAICSFALKKLGTYCALK